MCADQLDINDAHEVCRQLGYNGSISALGLTANRKGTGPVNNNDENCSESEARLAVCSHPGIGIEDGSHGEDAVAACESMPGQFNSHINSHIVCMITINVLKLITADADNSNVNDDYLAY